jgi:hypothetical protein
MESFLRNHPIFRWTLIFTLLFFITLQGLFIRNQLFAGDDGTTPGTGQPFGQTPAPVGVVLNCSVVAIGVNLRAGPSTDYEVLAELAGGTTITARGRQGDAPWLFINIDRPAEVQEGWVSSRLRDGRPLVECQGDLTTLPVLEAPPPGQ